jgi:hypothetical protein
MLDCLSDVAVKRIIDHIYESPLLGECPRVGFFIAHKKNSQLPERSEFYKYKDLQ